jgi:hypothetical protein
MSPRRSTTTDPSNQHTPANARDREMGRDVEPAGDLGYRKTWTPPPGEQGISNRPDDEAVEDAPSADDEDAVEGDIDDPLEETLDEP